jgi:carboxyl-terminal processing protease
MQRLPIISHLCCMTRYSLLLLLLLPYATFAQTKSSTMADSVKSYLDKSLSIIEQNALNNKDIDWNKLRKDVYDKASDAQQYEDILNIYPFIFERINDHHGSLKFRSRTYSWNKPLQNESSMAIKLATKKYTTVRSERICKDIGYILVPGNSDFRGQHMDSITKSIKKAIAMVNDKNIKGWIIDLRVNTGGNMYPMIAGLNDFIGEGKVGGFLTPTYQPDGNWIIKNGTFFVDSIKVTAVKYDGYPIKPNMPIAILISGNTASSGEMTAISTIGRKKSIVIGEISAGFTTSNLGFKLNDYSGLNLAVDYASDRKGKIYPKNIEPDIIVLNGDNFETLREDLKVIKAVSWIRGNK